MVAIKQAEQCYFFADVCRLFKLEPKRGKLLLKAGQMLGPDVIVPGGGHKAARWSASRVLEIKRAWSTSAPV